MVENCFSKGMATDDAMVSGLAPGRLALTVSPVAAGFRAQDDHYRQRELLIPIQFNGNEATIELTYDW